MTLGHHVQLAGHSRDPLSSFDTFVIFYQNLSPIWQKWLKMPDWTTQIDLLSHFLPQNGSQCENGSQLGNGSQCEWITI